MIMKSQKDLEDLKIGDKLYVAFAPKIEVYDTIFTFNTSANIDSYNPIFIFEKKTENEFDKVNDGIKRAYSINIFDVVSDINDYEQYNTHAYYVTTSKRETLKLLKVGTLSLMETVKRAETMVNRLVSDFNTSKLIVDNKELYPEDWV